MIRRYLEGRRARREIQDDIRMRAARRRAPYDAGGVLPPGITLAINDTDYPERVEIAPRS